MQFIDTVEDRFQISPEINTRLALPLVGDQEVYTHEVKLQFNFFKKNFTYVFYGLDNLMTQIGGAASAAAGFVKRFGAMFLVMFIIQFGFKISTSHKEKLKEFIDVTYRPKLPLYKKVVKTKLYFQRNNIELKKDLHNIEQLEFKEEWDDNYGANEGGSASESSDEKKDNLAKGLDKFAPDEELEMLENLERKHGKQAFELENQPFTEYPLQKAITERLAQSNVFETI